LNAFWSVLKNDRQLSQAESRRMITIKRSVIFFMLAMLTEFATAATTAQEIQTYDGWYRVEIIVFKPRKPLVDDELWPNEKFNYPDNMIAVSVANPDEITPYSLSQLDSISATPEALPTINLEPKPTASGYLFEGRGKHNRRLIESSNQLETESEETTEQINSVVTDPIEPKLDFAQADVLLDSSLPEAYRALPKESHTLKSVARSLRRSSKYDLALHKAWLQPISGTPSPILVQTGDQYDDLFEIDGTLSISRSRFLHIQADLWFTLFEPKYNQSQFMLRQPADISELAKDYPELIRVEKNRDTHIAVQSFPLHHSRRMRSSVLHYIDHPYFGVLVKIEKFDYPS
jgi:hypothetical protein